MSDRIPADFALRVDMGQSDPEIAAYAGVSPRTVLRWRHKLGLPSQWQQPAQHGTRSRYVTGCTCVPCTNANTAYAALVRRVYRNAQEARTA